MADLPPILEVWDFSNPEGTRHRFGGLAERAGREKDYVYQAEAVTQIARCQSLQGKFDLAHAVLDGVRTLRGGNHPRVRVRTALERGRTFNSAGDRPAALRQFRTAWEIAREHGEDYLAVDAAHMAAIASDLEGAEAWTQKGREAALAAESTAVLHWLGPLHNNLGWSYHSTGRHADAIEQFELSREAYRGEGDAVAVLIAGYAIGKTQRVMGRVEDAVATQEGLRREFEARGEEDGYVLEELALGYAARGRDAEARAAAARAGELLGADARITEREPERLERLRELAAD